MRVVDMCDVRINELKIRNKISNEIRRNMDRWMREACAELGCSEHDYVYSFGIDVTTRARGPDEWGY